MPWKVTKDPHGDGYVVRREDTNEVVSHHDSRAKANASLRARYANTPEARKK